MIRVTTPNDTFTLPIETDTCKIIQVTYAQGDYIIVKQSRDGAVPAGMSLDGKNVVITLTQDETKKFEPDDMVTVQVRVLTNSNEVFASKEFKIFVGDSLNEEILQ